VEVLAVLIENRFVYNTDREESHNSCHLSILAVRQIVELWGGRDRESFPKYICSVIDPHACWLWQTPDLHCTRIAKSKTADYCLLLLPLQLCSRVLDAHPVYLQFQHYDVAPDSTRSPLFERLFHADSETVSAFCNLDQLNKLGNEIILNLNSSLDWGYLDSVNLSTPLLAWDAHPAMSYQHFDYLYVFSTHGKMFQQKFSEVSFNL